MGGGIAAYKSVDLVRELGRQGATVQVAMTAAACRFITPLTLQTLSGRPVATDLLNAGEEAEIGHITIADQADVVIVAPATANLIARMAQGRADDVVTAALLATRAPVVVAPSMNTNMLEHPAVAQAAVIGVPDDEAGEIPKAFESSQQEVAAELVECGLLGKFKEVEETKAAENSPPWTSGRCSQSVS